MSAESKSTWLFRLTSPLAAGVVLAIFYAVLLTSLHDKSATFDEPGHAIAGYIYWKHGNYRIDPENGNLPQRLIALPLLFGDFKFPSTESNAWRNSDSWPLADAWFNRLGNDTAAMLARGRAGAGLIAVALGAMIWLWSRRFFGPAGGMLSLLLYALNPAVLANGALITSDIASALAFLAASWSFWAMLEKFSPTRVLLSALVVSALFITKVSAVLFIPMAVAMVVARLIDGRPLPVGGLRALSGRKWQFLAIVAGAVVHAVVIFAVIWAAYGFRFAASAPGPNSPTRFVFPWEWALDQPNHIELINRLNLPASQQQQAREIFESSGVLVNQWSFESIEALRIVRNRVLTPAQTAQLDELMSAPPPRAAARLALFARTHHLLPEAYLFGYAHVWKLSNERSAFLNGEFRTTGWWWFFPYAFAVKTPLVFFGFLALAFLGTARLQSRNLRRRWTD